MDTPDVHQRTGVLLRVEARTNGTTFRVPDFALGHKINFIFLKSSNFQNINNYVNYGNKTITMQLRTLNETSQRKLG
ncbi:hypothetical protein BTUL_0054g00320 [Botrytis tulipae]|uniref:Uncharacterized protein n=1 Tax=Botrytis tulipae TaxID=87230 RepID=A0A4Z1EV49_9HELO|nr:hypothetical protein BTUL_0054g00320 [Botrytis tulipae]